MNQRVSRLLTIINSLTPEERRELYQELNTFDKTENYYERQAIIERWDKSTGILGWSSSGPVEAKCRWCGK